MRTASGRCAVFLLAVALGLSPILAGCTQQAPTFNLNEGWIRQSKSAIRQETGEFSVLEYAKHPQGATLVLMWRRMLQKHFENKFSAVVPLLAMSFGAKVNTVSEPAWTRIGDRKVLFATAEYPKKFFFYGFYENDTMYILMGIVDPPLNAGRAMRFKSELESTLVNFKP